MSARNYSDVQFIARQSLDSQNSSFLVQNSLSHRETGYDELQRIIRDYNLMKSRLLSNHLPSHAREKFFPPFICHDSTQIRECYQGLISKHAISRESKQRNFYLLTLKKKIICVGDDF